MMTNEVPTPLGMETPITEQDDQFATTETEFAIDRTTSPFEQQKINDFIALLVDDDGDVSVRDLIPINFKPKSRLNTGMYTPTNASPATSRPSSRRGSITPSPSTSKPSSRRGSIAASSSTSKPSSRRSSITASPSTSRPSSRRSSVVRAEVTASLDSAKSINSSKLFATQSSLLTTSHKTPYTSAAATPLQTPDYEKENYFGFVPLSDPVPIPMKTSSTPTKPDFLNKATYSLDLSLNTSKVSTEWDPYKALKNLKTESENMVIRKSLEESFRSSIVDGSFGEYNTAPQKKKKSVMSYNGSAYNDKELMENSIDSKSEPAAPVPNRSREIQKEKERYQQQYTALSLTKTQAALASTLEAELELSQGNLLKRELYDNESTELPLYDDVELLAGDEVPIDESSIAYFDPHVIQESKKKLNNLLKDEITIDKSPLPISRSNPVPQVHHNISVNEMHLEPQPFSLLFDKNRYLPNFGFKDSKKFNLFEDDTNENDSQGDPVLSFKPMASDTMIPNVPRKKKHATSAPLKVSSDDSKKQTSDKSDAPLEIALPSATKKSPTQSSSAVAKTNKEIVKDKKASKLEDSPNTQAAKDVSKVLLPKSKSTKSTEPSQNESQSLKSGKINLKSKPETSSGPTTKVNTKETIPSSSLKLSKAQLKTDEAKAPATCDKSLVDKKPLISKPSSAVKEAMKPSTSKPSVTSIDSKHESTKAGVTKKSSECKASPNSRNKELPSVPSPKPQSLESKIDKKPIEDKSLPKLDSTKVSKKDVSKAPPELSKGIQKKENLKRETPKTEILSSQGATSDIGGNKHPKERESLQKVDEKTAAPSQNEKPAPSTNPKTLKKKRARERKRAAALSENSSVKMPSSVEPVEPNADSSEKEIIQPQDTSSSIPASSFSKKSKKNRKHRKK
jgi:hypothetical protein